MFQVNEVLAFEGVRYRILSSLGDQLVWINIDDARSFPTLVMLDELERAIVEEQLIRSEDPYAEVMLCSPTDGSVQQVKRDANYSLILPIITDPQFYEPKYRAAKINSILSSTKTTKQTLYRLIRRYWQRGQVPNALLPDYKNSGAKGRKRSGQGNKLGRPRVFAPGRGAIVTEHVEQLFRRTIEKYLLTDKKITFVYAHRRFKTIYQNYYPDVLEEEMPSFWQFKYFYNREYGLVQKLEKRYSKTDYRKDIKPLRSTATKQALGPGSRYEIDATIADIYLVSDRDRHQIIGRPTIYMVIDVFSRMVAGLYVGLENPSYATAMQALASALSDKVDVCRGYGVQIQANEWPCSGLPDAILADRGELLGHQIESLEKAFSVRIENTPPYMGAAKGIVERSFRTIQADFKPFAPGTVAGKRVKKHGERDYRIEAVLSISEFKEIILRSVLVHNQYNTLDKYDRATDMPADLVMTPLSIWNWGLQNRTGRLRTVREDVLKVSLLPRVKVTLSDLGVCAFGLYFSCPELIKKGWFHRSREVARPSSFEAAYDPGAADHIYLFPNMNSTECWRCNLTDRSREYMGLSFWEAWARQKVQKATSSRSNLVSSQKKREHELFIEHKIKEAQKKKASSVGLPEREQLAAIKKNRSQAKEEERAESAYRPPKKSKNQAATIVKLPLEEGEDYGYPDHLTALFDEDN